MVHLVNSQVCRVIMYKEKAIDAVQLRAETKAAMTPAPWKLFSSVDSVPLAPNCHSLLETPGNEDEERRNTLCLCEKAERELIVAGSRIPPTGRYTQRTHSREYMFMKIS